jgi:hypothetical protein
MPHITAGRERFPASPSAPFVKFAYYYYCYYYFINYILDCDNITSDCQRCCCSTGRQLCSISIKGKVKKNMHHRILQALTMCTVSCWQDQVMARKVLFNI